MNFEYSEKTQLLMSQLKDFMDQYIYPNEETYGRQMEAFGTNRWQIPAIMGELKEKAQAWPGA